MSLDKLVRPVAVIDMANLRDNSNIQRLRHRKRVYSSWDYIDSVIASLKSCVNNLTIIPIFDAGLANNFAGFDNEITNFRKSLNYLDEDYIYFLREHRVEADPLILQVALEVGGFVISGDKYRKYSDKTKIINDMIFVPVKNDSSAEFEFFKSSEFYEIRGKHRNFEDLMKNKVQTLKSFIDVNSDSIVNDSSIREQVFGNGGIESRFWDNNFRTTKQEKKEALNYQPFADTNFSLSRLFGDEVAPKVSVRAFHKTGKKVKTKERVVLFCDCLSQVQPEADSEVFVVGKLGRSGDQMYLEWFRGDKAVRITGFHTRKDLDKNFIKIPGVLSRGSEGFELKTAEDAEFEQLSFGDAVIHRLSRIVVRKEDEAPRRWFLPSLNWGRKINITVPKQPRTIPPPPGYRYRTSEERLLDLESGPIRAERLKPEVIKDSDSSWTQEIPFDKALLEHSAALGGDLSPPNLEMSEESQSGSESMSRQKFELSRQPIFRTAFRKRRTHALQSGPQKRRWKWLLVFLLAIAAAFAFFAVNFRSETTKKEVPTVSLKCWGEIEKICVET